MCVKCKESIGAYMIRHFLAYSIAIIAVLIFP